MAASTAAQGRFAQQLKERFKTSTAAGATGAASIMSNLSSVSAETIRLFPESLVLASGIFALFTLSYPIAIFFGTMVETSLLYRLFRSAAEYLTFSPESADARRDSAKCRSGLFQQADYTDVSLFAGIIRSNVFPSYPVFIASTAAAYVFSTLNTLSKDLEILGPAYSSRYYTSMIFSSLLLFVLIAYRVLYSCDSAISLLLTAALGCLLGVILVQQNKALFGKESLNMVGIPLLKSRTATGQNIYICPK